MRTPVRSAADFQLCGLGDSAFQTLRLCGIPFFANHFLSVSVLSVSDRLTFAGRNGAGEVKGDLKTLGMELAKFSELAGRLEELLDVTLEVTKRTRGDYTNVYFNRRIRIAATSNGDVPSGNMPF
jgi:hypothetical protein